VNEINALRLDSRVDEGNGKDEIARLAITFNEMLERLELAFNNQRQFVSNVSHELRTPLTSLSGLLEVTLLKKREVEEYEALLKSMLEDIKTLNSLSNGLLELANSNIDVPAFQLKTSRIDEILFAAQSDLLKTQSAYVINVNFDEMPDEEHKLLVRANDNLLKIAFINLMDNACKFSPQKRSEVNIAFNDKQVILKFSDTGIGIPDEELNRVLEPFYRASNSSQKQGHGIGLSLVKRIIEMHHGTLVIRSEVGVGTKITVSLPYS
jgi:signal transduction histidine kinase